MYQNDQKDLWAWSLGLMLSIAALSLWAVFSIALDEKSMPSVLAAFFLGASIMRAVHSSRRAQGTSLVWAASGACLFFLAGGAMLFLNLSMVEIGYLGGAVIFADILLGLYASFENPSAKQRNWILTGSLILLTISLGASFDMILESELLISFLLTMGLCAHSVASLSLFIHLQKDWNPSFAKVHSSPAKKAKPSLIGGS